MKELMQMSDVFGEIKAYFAFMEGKEYLRLSSSLPIGERFRRIRHNYNLYQQTVDAGLASWMHTNQYEVGDWLSIFTPIEMAAWQDIRANGLPLWPQLPVGRFFVDFGNPVVKVALECDGKQWHDPVKDEARDRVLWDLGWTVYRADGRRCKKVMPFPDDFDALDRVDQEDFIMRRRRETMEGLIEDLKDEFRGKA